MNRRGSQLLPGLRRERLKRELLAGLTLLAIGVPLNIGYAQIAGLPASAGLYALIFPLLVFALTASSRHIAASPDATAAALVASSVGALAAAGHGDYLTLVFAQAILSGVMFLIMGVCRLGFLSNFFSRPILIGFIGGLALDILVSQIAKMLGLSLPRGGEFFTKVVALLQALPETHVWSLLIACGAIAIMLLGRRVARLVPWALIVLAGCTILMSVTNLAAVGVASLGPVTGGFPPVGWPTLDWHVWLLLVPSALALTFVTTAEGLLLARSYAAKYGYRIRPDQDLQAYGFANIAAGLTGGFAIGSSTSRSAAMVQAGSRSQLPSLVAVVGALLLLLFGTTVLEQVPAPAIGAVVALAVFPLIGIAELRELWHRDRVEFLVASACFALTLLVGPIGGILLAFVLSLLNFARRAAAPAVDILSSEGEPLAESSAQAAATISDPEAFTIPGVVVLRFASPVFFASVSVFVDTIHSILTSRGDALQHLVLDLEAVTDVDVSGAQGIHEALALAEAARVRVSWSRVRPDLARRLAHLGVPLETPVFRTNRDAVAALRDGIAEPGAD